MPATYTIPTLRIVFEKTHPLQQVHPVVHLFQALVKFREVPVRDYGSPPLSLKEGLIFGRIFPGGSGIEGCMPLDSHPMMVASRCIEVVSLWIFGEQLAVDKRRVIG